MPIKPHPDFDEIKQVLQTLSKKGKAFSAVCYRCAEPKFAKQLVSGLGSRLYGARWTPKGSFPSTYLCDSAEAALAEYLARARRMRLPDHKSLPVLMAGVRVKVGNLLDTTDPKIAAECDPLLKRDKIHWRAIQDRREAVSQAFGRAIHEICFCGLIAPSQAAPGACNIIVFPQKLTGSDLLEGVNLDPIRWK
jgi:RES domain-containing protein